MAELIDGLSSQEREPYVGIRNLRVSDGDQTPTARSRGAINVFFLNPSGVGLRFTEEAELLFKVVDMGFGPA